MALQQNNISKMPDFLKQAIKKEIEIATEEELKKAQERIEKRKKEIIAGVVLHIQEMIQMETLDRKLILTIKLEK